MKTKLIRKIRERFNVIEYDVNWDGELWVIDNKTKVIRKYITICILFELMGIDYYKLNRLRVYNREIRKQKKQLTN